MANIKLKYLNFIFFVILLISLPLVVFITKQRQQSVQYAASGMPPTTPTTSVSTRFSLTLCPHGLGNCDDNSNSHAQGNPNPLHTTRMITVTVSDTSNHQVTKKQGSVVYYTSAGNFQGIMDVGTIASGTYTITVHMDGFLNKSFPQQRVTQGQTTILPTAYLVTGDINNDNSLDFLDYNVLLSCWGSKYTTSSCLAPTSTISPGADIYDHGQVDGITYNEFLREFFYYTPDLIPTPTPTSITPTAVPTYKPVSIQTPTISTQPANSNSGFITAKGKELVLNNKPMKFIGFNAWLTGSSVDTCGDEVLSDTDIDNAFSQMHDHGENVVRIWFYESFTQDLHHLTRIDYILSEAQKYNIYIIAELDSHQQYCTGEGDGLKSLSWYQGGYKNPAGTNPSSFKDYAGRIANHYKNNPNILMWAIIGEPMVGGSCDYTALLNFTSDIATIIKQNDPNHLVGLGSEAMGCSQLKEYDDIPNLLDVIVIEDYNSPTVALPSWVDRGLKLAQAKNKPIINIESGITDSDCGSVSGRVGCFINKMNAFFNGGGSAFSIWVYKYHNTATGMFISPTDPLHNAIKTLSASLNP